jgi:glycosyltransferase domain-containing protein
MTQDVSIMVPTRDRPAHLKRLLEFLRLSENRCPVHILDGSAPEIEHRNAALAARYSFAKYTPYGVKSHMGVRCSDGLRHVTTPYTVFCADDDFVFPFALAECARFLAEHADHSVAIGRVYALSYMQGKAFFERGIMLDNHLRFTGYLGHERFLQRALYYVAYTYIGSSPLFYGVKHTDTAREAFGHATEAMKYSGVELLSNTVALIKGKVGILDVPFGLRDYSTPTIVTPVRHDPNTYLAEADLAYLKPFFTALLAESERMPVERAAEHIELYLSQWAPPDWKAPSDERPTSGVARKLGRALALMRSMYVPATLARQFDLPEKTVDALMAVHRGFIAEQ